MEKFQQELRHYEGVRYDIYPDPLHGASHATVGVGHLLIPGDKHYGQFHSIFNIIPYFLIDRSAHRDQDLTSGPDDLPQQGLGQCLEGRQEALPWGV